MKQQKTVLGIVVIIIVAAVAAYLIYYYMQDESIDNTCVSSDEYCEDKTDGTSCSTGVWCDKQGRVCGGLNCPMPELGKCRSGKCVPDRVANTYTNSQYDYSFTYDSSEYKITESKSIGGAIQEESDLTTLAAKGEDSCPVSLTIFISTADLDVELADLDFRIDGTTTKTTVDSAEATKRAGALTENLPECGDKVTDVVFEHNDHTFSIRAFENSTDFLDETLLAFKLL